MFRLPIQPCLGICFIKAVEMFDEKINRKKVIEEVIEMTTETALGRLSKAGGVPDWDDIFPAEICNRCSVGPKCLLKDTCAALTVIGTMAAITFATPAPKDVQSFVGCLKKALSSVRKPNQA